MAEETHCPLCNTTGATHYFEDARRPYYLCGCCALVFVPTRYLPDRQAERAEYLQHQNNEYDAGYRSFLARLANPLVARLPAGAQGLDFGCGPGPALALMLREQGFEVAVYDSFFAPDPAALNVQYDFITATEVVEHLHHPGAELARLWGLLRPGGLLGLMTKLVLDRDAFARWHYKNDPTHVVFFSRKTFSWWGAARGVVPDFIGADVILLRKQD